MSYKNVLSLLLLSLLAGGCGGGTENASYHPDPVRIAAIAERAMAEHHLKALILQVTADGHPIYSEAFGESIDGVPATVSMKVRNGFVAYSYLATILLELVDRGQIRLDEKLAVYFPDLPRSEAITIHMLGRIQI